MKVQIAPSILAADFSRLGDEVRRVEDGGADLLHVDVMDGHFVPNLTMGVPVVEALKRTAQVPLDVHLMIENPDRYLDAFVQAGAASLSVHVEVCPHLHRTLTRIRALGAAAGVAVNPSTPITAIADVTHLIDLVLIMSVNPGFTGQSFIPETPRKIRETRVLLDTRGATARIGVDGGIGLGNAAAVVGAGATMLVAGATVFHAADPAAALRALRAEAERG